MSKVGIPQPFPKPLDVYNMFSSKNSSTNSSTNSSKKQTPPLDIPLLAIPGPSDLYNRFSSSSNRSDKLSRMNKKKCPKGTRKNRKTKVCETHSQIQFRTRRQYRKGAYKKCPKGTRRNKLSNICEPK
jgi:hypothetical protein